MSIYGSRQIIKETFPELRNVGVSKDQTGRRGGI
jgi:hypothetical protein